MADGSVANEWFLVSLPLKIWKGGGWGIHISLAAILEGVHISLVICVRGYTYHAGTHITVPVDCTSVGCQRDPRFAKVVTFRN